MAVRQILALAPAEGVLRDTELHAGDAVGVGGFSSYGVLVTSSLDAGLEVVVEGDVTPSFARPVELARSQVAQGVTYWRVFTDPLPWLRVSVRAQAAPTVGQVVARVLGRV